MTLKIKLGRDAYDRGKFVEAENFIFKGEQFGTKEYTKEINDLEEYCKLYETLLHKIGSISYEIDIGFPDNWYIRSRHHGLCE